MRYGRSLRRLWLIDPEVDYLNHGSFGAAPHEVLAVQDRLRREMERELVDFLDERLPKLLRRAADGLGAFLGARGEDLVFTDNATSGANAVLRSFPFKPGDEILLATHSYPAVLNTAGHVAKVRQARVPFHPRDPAEMIWAFEKALTRRTRLAVVDHVASPSALIFPVQEIAALCRARGIRVLVDGAHAPGMLPLDVPGLGADWYVGNLHKWLFAPKGSAFLWASKAGQNGLHPAVLSNNYGKGYTAEFDWCGTKDPTPWLCVPAALEFHRRLGGARLMRRNRDLAWAMGERLSRAWRAPSAPREFFGSMVSLELPLGGRATEKTGERLHDLLRRRGVEVPLFWREKRLLLRISAQAYNEPADYDRLERLVSTFIS